MKNRTKSTTEDQDKQNGQKIIDNSDSKFTQVVSKKSINKEAAFNEIPKDKEYELDKIDSTIIEFTSRNPGCCKEYLNKIVVNNRTLSHVTIKKHTGELLKAGFLICEKDKKDKRKEHMYINKQDVLLALVSNLQSFEASYFNLIENMQSKGMKTILNECRVSIREIFLEYDIIRPLFTIFTVIIHVSQFYVLFNSKDYPSSNVSSVKIIVYEILDRINNKLNSLNFIKKYNEYKEDIYFNSFSETDTVPDMISKLLNIMKICKLDQEVESLIDSFWNICIDVLPSLDPFFCRFTTNQLQNWKQIMKDFESSIYSKKTVNPSIHKLMSSG